MLGYITTILAIVAALVFYDQSIYWALVLVSVLATLSAYTGHLMNVYKKIEMARGFSESEATQLIPDRVAAVSMYTTFAVWGFFGYSMYIR